MTPVTPEMASNLRHWPTQIDLIRDAVIQIGDLSQHHEPTGDLRTDLIGELLAFSDGRTKHHLARVLGGLAETRRDRPLDRRVQPGFSSRGQSSDVSDPPRPPRSDVEFWSVTLSGAVLYRAMVRGEASSRRFIEQLVL